MVSSRLVREPPSFRTGGSGSRRPQNRGSGSGSGSRVYVVQSAARNLVSCRNKKLIQIQNNYNYYYTTNDCYVVCTLHAQVHAFTSHTSSYDFNTCIHHHEWKEQKQKMVQKIKKLSFESKIDLFRNRLGTGPKMTVPVPVLGWPEPRVTRNRLTSLPPINALHNKSMH